MINWKILGISQTTDTSVIKKAYRAQLAETNPEDKPEEFMALREAYEQALEYARNGGKDPAQADEDEQKDLLPPEHPAYDWTKRLQALYWDFPRRIRPECWTELAGDPLCTRIDTAGDVERALLTFFMAHWYVPDAVICALNEVFHFEQNQERLMEEYPNEFVDAILLTPLHRYISFEYQYLPIVEGANYDEFMRLYYQLTNLVAENQKDEAEQCLQALRDTGLSHPYLYVEEAKLRLNMEDPDAAEALLLTAKESWPICPSVNAMLAEVDLDRGENEKAKEKFSAILERYPEYLWAKIGMGESCLKLGEYDEAEDWISQALYMDRYSQRAKALEQMIGVRQQETLAQKQADGQASAEELLKLGILYVDANEDEKGCEVLQSFHAEKPLDEAMRFHYLATAYLDLNENEKALANFQEAEKLMRQQHEVASDEDTRVQIESNITRTMVMASIAYEQMGKPEDALQIVTNATVDFPDRPMVICRKAELLLQLDRYQEAIDAASESIRRDSSFHLPYKIRAMAYFELDMYSDAFEDCNNCLDLYSGDLQVFIYKVKILIRVGEPDAALEILDDLEQSVQGTYLVHLRALALAGKDDLAGARKLYEQVIAMDADQTREVFYPAELPDLADTYDKLFWTIRRICEDSEDYTDWRLALEYLEKGHERYPDNMELLDDLSAEYFGMDMYTQAAPLYQRMVELEPTSGHYAQRAGNAIHMDKFDVVERDLDKAQELEPEITYAEILRGALANHHRNYTDALLHYDKAADLAQKNGETWYRIYREMASVYCRMRDYDQAIATIEQNIALYQRQFDVSIKIDILRMAGRYEEGFRVGEEYLREHADETASDLMHELIDCAEAAEDFERVKRYCALLGEDYYTNINLGRHAMYQGDFKEAVRFFLLAEKASPYQINNSVYLAKAYLQMKNHRKAKEYANRTLASIPDDYMINGDCRAYHLTRSGEALAVLGDFAEAKKHLLAAISSRPCDTCDYSACLDAYNGLLYLACLQGDEEAAAEYRAKAQEILPDDYDTKHILETFMTKKKKGFFR